MGAFDHSSGSRAPAEVGGGAAAASSAHASRTALLEELWSLYGDGSGSGAMRTWRYQRKRLVWRAVTKGAWLFKRCTDVAASLAGLLLLSPLFAAVALAIKLADRGPVLYWQTRVGRFGREFDFPKFRSMVVNSNQLRTALETENQHGAGVTFKIKRDPRVTAVGRVIRKLSIDELPQLWCVLCGDMSLVGPRPPMPSEVARYSLAERRRLDVLPGLTCIWQVSGRADLSFDQQVRLDVLYIRNQSLWGDLVLLLKTVPAVLLGRGAY